MPDKPNLILVSGFGWSGSGAVLDFFREHPQVKIAGNDEIIFLWLLQRIISRYRAGKYIRTEGEMESLFCAKVPRSYTDQKQRQYVQTFKDYFDGDDIVLSSYQEYAGLLIKKLAQTNHATIGEDGLKAIFAQYLGTLYSFLNQRTGIQIIFDNLLHPQNLDMLLLFDLSGFESVHIFCVDRDPRQQFHDQFQRYASGAGLWHTFNWRQKVMTRLASTALFRKIWNTGFIKLLAANKFISMYLQKRNSFKRNREYVLHDQHLRIRLLGFEEFVKDEHHCRDNLRDEFIRITGLDKSMWQTGKFFIPEQSALNMYKFASEHSKFVYEVIRRKLMNR